MYPSYVSVAAVLQALIPNKPAPRLVLKSHVDSMKPGTMPQNQAPPLDALRWPHAATDGVCVVSRVFTGSVIIDLSSEAGGNCEYTVPGEVVRTPNGVTVVGFVDLPSRLPTQVGYTRRINRVPAAPRPLVRFSLLAGRGLGCQCSKGGFVLCCVRVLLSRSPVPCTQTISPSTCCLWAPSHAARRESS